MTEPTWLTAAWAEYGQHETAGRAANPRIRAMFADAGHPAVVSDETAWCAAFVGAVLQRSGLAPTRSLRARSYLEWGEPLDTVRPGAIAVFSRGTSPAEGHVGFVLGATRTGDLTVLGGNQSDAVTVALMPRDRLLGMRWPVVVPAAADATDRDAASFDDCLRHVLAQEGGWSDDPHDPGGATNFGITLADYVAFTGKPLTVTTRAHLTDELRDIPPATVRAIYERLYWHPSCAPHLPPALALMHFDASVNMGVGTAARLLQRALAVDVDGVIGPLTRAAAQSRPLRATLARYAELRRTRYRALSTFWRFGRGWLARVDRTLAAAQTLIPQPKGEPIMQNTTNTPAAGKWWVQSLTVWGTLVTMAATVLPVVGPLLGLNLSAEIIHQLGDGVVQVAQAVGGVVGIIMTIWGRSRASAPLERRQVTLQL